MDSRIKTIADHYGYEAQSRQCMEECAELIQAINKLWRVEYYDGNNIREMAEKERGVTEELVDVQIMIQQIAYLLDVGEIEWMHLLDKKLERQMRRIKEESK